MKRILAFGLVLLLILGLFPLSALAENTSPAFVIDGGKAQQGDTVQVTLSTLNNPGIVSLKVKIGYDSNVLSLTAMEGADFEGITFGPVTKNPATVNWLNSLEPNNTTNGVVAVLTFNVLETAKDGDTLITATYNPNDVFDYNQNNVAFDVVNGVVAVGCTHKETTIVPAKSSTCLEQGNEEYTYCNECETVIAGSNQLLPLGECDFTAQAVTDQYKVSDATCVDQAVYYHSCTLCGAAGKTTFTAGDVDETNHVGGTHLEGEYDATYDAPGYTGNLCCDSCGDVVKSGEEIPQLQKLNGLVQDGDSYRYLVDGKAQSGWFEIDGEWYYFFEDTLAAKEGSYQVGDVEYTFEETGQLVSGVWANTLYGVRYYYGPSHYSDTWAEIEGETYYFDGGYRVVGYAYVPLQESTQKGVCYFDEQGVFVETLNGLSDLDGTLRYYENGAKKAAGLIEIDGSYYFADNDGAIARGRTYVWKGNDIVAEDNYLFHQDGKMAGVTVVNGEPLLGELLASEDGSLRYYQMGKPSPAGLVLVDGHYYFAGVEGEISTGLSYVWKGNGILPEDNYLFREDGKLVGMKEEADQTVLGEIAADGKGVLRYYQKGKTAMAGLVLVDGYYYFADVEGEIRTGMAYVWRANGIVPEDNYMFHPDGRMMGVKVENSQTLLGEIVDDGTNVKRYYQMGKTAMAGLVLVDGYYYFADVEGEIRTGNKYVWKGNGIVPESMRNFDAEGKMLGVKVVDGKTVLGQIANVDGTARYYEMGQTAMAGLVLIDGYYYFADVEGEIRTGNKYVWKGNGIVPESMRNFDAEGKMLGVKVVDGETVLGQIANVDGTARYYEMGQTAMAGLVLIDGYYYFADVEGEIRTGNKYVWKGNGIVPESMRNFDQTGKMLGVKVVDGETVLGQIANVDGTARYYEMGQTAMAGLVLVDGYYYFADVDGEIRTGKTYVWRGNGLVAEGSYLFREDGRMIGAKAENGKTVLGELVTDANGSLVYYQWGQPTVAGFVEVDGAYYFADVDGKIAIGRTYVWKGNGLVAEGHYEFDESGKAYHGFVTKEDGLYYYQMGACGKEGLHYIDGYYYCIGSDGKLWTNGSYYVWKTNGYSVPMTYTFDELGRVVL